jgi:hypothetical protein
VRRNAWELSMLRWPPLTMDLRSGRDLDMAGGTVGHLRRRYRMDGQEALCARNTSTE